MKMAMGGMAIGLLLNSITETKYGVKIFPIDEVTTPDTVDLAYGAIAATTGAAVGSKIEQTPATNELDQHSIPVKHS